LNILDVLKVIGPGGKLGDYGKYPNCTGGVARYIDIKLFGMNHIYESPTPQQIYLTGYFDPEGLLGNLTSIFLCYCGVQVGRIILYFKDPVNRVIRLAIWGIILGGIGTTLCWARQDGGWIPINKNLWSLSFVLVMGGTGNLVLAFSYLLIDVFDIWNGAPFIYIGMNSILIYVGSELLGNIFPFNFSSANTHLLRLTRSLLGMTVWLLISFYLYLHKFFVNI